MSFEYRGDSAGEFPGIAHNPRAKNIANRFLCIIDEDWGHFSFSRWGVTESTLRKVARFAERIGARGLILPGHLHVEELPENLDVFVTDSTIEFAMRAAEVVSGQRGESRLTAITGSVGKSTTNAMLNHVMRTVEKRRDLYAPLRSPNTHPAVLGHLTRSKGTKHTLIEVAGSALHYFARYQLSMEADVAIITSISEAHLDLHGSLSGILRDKGEIFTRPPSSGTAIFNADSPHAEEISRRALREGRQLLPFGESDRAAIRLLDYDSSTREVVAGIGKERISYTIGAPGRHLAINSLAVLAALRAHGYKQWRVAIQTLASYDQLSGRGKTIDVPLPSGGTVHIVDDSYNANPASMRASLAAFGSEYNSSDARKVALLGDMLELGDTSAQAHRDLLPDVTAVGFDEIHLLGHQMSYLSQALSGQHNNQRQWATIDQLAASFPGLLRDGDVMLVKGSRSTGLYQFIKSWSESSKTPEQHNLA